MHGGDLLLNGMFGVEKDDAFGSVSGLRLIVSLVSSKLEHWQRIVNCQVICGWILGVTAAAGFHRVENLWQY